MASNEVLFRKLTQTDFNGMNGKAQQAGTGGGAMHIPLGVNSTAFPIKRFLAVSRGSNKTIRTEPWGKRFGQSTLTFDGNPARRNGEWRIADQFNHRHPAWTSKQGFRSKYNSRDRPVIFVIGIGGAYHVRLRHETDLKSAPISLASALAGIKNKGILKLQPEWAAYFDLLAKDSPLKAAAIAAAKAAAKDKDDFIPGNKEDGRKRAMMEIVRRQGQPKFRRALMKAYNSKCAISRCAVTETLQAAHITPYLGPNTNHVKNGLLLRADIHTLYDLGLITIDPDTMRAQVSSLIRASDYGALHGRRLQVPTRATKRPSAAALKEQFSKYQP